MAENQKEDIIFCDPAKTPAFSGKAFVWETEANEQMMKKLTETVVIPYIVKMVFACISITLIGISILGIVLVIASGAYIMVVPFVLMMSFGGYSYSKVKNKKIVQ